MKKSQFISLGILFIVVAIIIIVGAGKDKPMDNTQNMMPTIPPSTPTATAPANTQAPSTEAPATPTPATKPVVDNIAEFDSYPKTTPYKITTKDKNSDNDEVVFSNSELTEALKGFNYILSNPGTNSTTDVYICIMLNSYTFNAETTRILDFAKTNSVKLSFFANGTYLTNSANHEIIRRIHNEGHTLGIRGDFSAMSHQGLIDATWTLELQYQSILKDQTFRTNFYTPENRKFSQRDIALLNEIGYIPVFRYQSVIDSTTKNKTYDGVLLRVYMSEEGNNSSDTDDVINYITWGLQQGYKFAGLATNN